MSTTCVDFETYYDTSCSIRTQGVYPYTRHPKFDAYMVSLHNGEETYVGHPLDFEWSCLQNELKVSHNAFFDRAVAKKIGIVFDPNTWNCTANLAAYMKSKRSLKDAAKSLLGIEVSKDVRAAARGKTWKHMKRCSAIQDRRFNSFADQMADYALHDAEVSRLLWEKYSPQWPEDEQKLSLHTLNMCERGLLIDTEYCSKCIAALQEEVFQAAARLPWREDPSAPALSHLKLGAQCRKEGIPVPKSIAEDSKEFLLWDREYGEKFTWVADMRIVRKANMLLKRFLKLRDNVDENNRFQFGMKYFGAHTGRWSGDDGFNVHNFPRDKYVTSSGVECDLRQCVIAPPGKKLIIADFAQIEARILAFMAGQDDVIELVRQGFSIYEVHARKTMGWTGGDLKKENSNLYRLAKARVLSLGYGCGVERFIDTVKLIYGIDLSGPEGKQTVFQYRKTSPQIVRLWQRMENGLIESVGGNYEVELPSGRFLTYRNVQRREAKMEVGKRKGGDLAAQVLIDGPSQRIYGALAVENCVYKDTKVITLRGVLPITEVRKGDFVWDGENWIKTDGCAHRGKKPVGTWLGVKITADHLIWLGGNSWKSVTSLDELKSQRALNAARNSMGTQCFSRRRILKNTPCVNASAAGSIACRIDNFFGRLECAQNAEPNSVPENSLKNEDMSLLFQTSALDSCGYTDELGSSQDVIAKLTKPTSITAKGESDYTLSGEKILSRGSSTRKLLTDGTTRNLTWIASTTIKDIFQGICDWFREKKIAKIDDAQFFYRGKEYSTESKNFETNSAQNGKVCFRCTTNSSKKGHRDKLWRLTNDTVDVYDLLNCGPNNRFTIITDAGPVIIHNCIQAVARDVMAHSILALEKAGLSVLFHVHDEIVLEVEKDVEVGAVEEIMSTEIPWLDGCPIGVEACESLFYKK